MEKLTDWQMCMLEKALIALEKQISAEHGDESQVADDTRKLLILIAKADEIKVSTR